MKKSTEINQINLLTPTVINSKLQQYMTPQVPFMFSKDMEQQGLKLNNLSKLDKDKIMN